VAGDDAVARDDLLLHAEVAAAVGHQLVHFLEAAGVEQQVHPFAGGQSPGIVLLAAPLGAAAFFGAALTVAKGLDGIHGWGVPQAATQGLLSEPTPSIFTIMRSPGSRGPTPEGVPVVMMSPGCSVMNRVTCSMSCGTGKISWLVFEW
jgi:hypothetical protein